MVAPLKATDFIRDEYFTRNVTVNGIALDCIMVPIKEQFDVLAVVGLSYEHWEAIFAVADLQSNGLPVPLADGTTITDDEGRVYQVNPIRGQAHWRWPDAWHEMVAMRCKQITVAQ